MINLLPVSTKQEIRAARLNVILFRYILILALGIGFLGMIVGGSYIILGGVETTAKTTIATNNQKASSFGSTQAEADALRNNLESAKTVLSADIDYTKLLTGIAALVPEGVVLDKLTLNPAVFGTASTVQVYAKTTEDAIALKDAFSTSPLFSNVSFQSISNKSGITGYPVNVQMSVVINKVTAQ